MDEQRYTLGNPKDGVLIVNFAQLVDLVGDESALESLEPLSTFGFARLVKPFRILRHYEDGDEGLTFGQFLRTCDILIRIRHQEVLCNAIWALESTLRSERHSSASAPRDSDDWLDQ